MQLSAGPRARGLVSARCARGVRLAAAAVAAIAWAGATRPAVADGEVAMRGAYYKEEATRVVQPMLDARFDAGPDTDVRVHALVDAITSASVAAGAGQEPFSGRRYESGGAVSYQLGDLRLGGQGRYSYEPDYQSVFGGVRVERDFANKNTTVGAGFSIGRDDLSNAGAQSGMGPAVGEEITGELATTLGSVSLAQVLSPVLVVNFAYDISYLSGFQENAYREVIAGGMRERERVPDERTRHAVAGAVRGFVPATDTTLAVGYRFYADDWGIRAHTPEVRMIQSFGSARGESGERLGGEIDVHLRYRYHRQGAAEFFKSIYDSTDPAVEPFITDDVKLSAFSTHTLGVKFESPLVNLGMRGSLARVRADVVIEYIIQNNRFGNAVAGQFALTVPFEY